MANKHRLKDARKGNLNLKLIKVEGDKLHINSMQTLLEDNQEVIINPVSKFQPVLVSQFLQFENLIKRQFHFFYN